MKINLSNFHGRNTGTYTANAYFRLRCKQPFMSLESHIFNYLVAAAMNSVISFIYLLTKSRLIIPV